MRNGTDIAVRQIRRFHLTEFLKTQRYFIPVMILFLQFYKLSYTEIFILYAVESGLTVLLEIPSGVVADQFGKKACLVFSRLILIPAYLLFAVSDGFWGFFLAMVLMALNKAFKSGTHKAFIYDYLAQNHPEISSTEVFGKNKFWARLGEAAASLVGGFVAARLGFSAVFWLALLPALLNLINVLGYAPIEERHKSPRISLKDHLPHIKESVADIRCSPVLRSLIVNSAVFVVSMEAAEKFFQPYMLKTGIPVGLFGIVYAVIMLISAFGTRYVHLLEGRLGILRIVNLSGWLGVLPLLVLGLGWTSMGGVFLFFLILFLKTARRPPIITEMNRHICDHRRATILSTDSLVEKLLGFVLFPLAGWISDASSFAVTSLALAGLLVFNQVFLPARRGEPDADGRGAEDLTEDAEKQGR
jgi:MFS family permease